jgi:hypothetical protein
VDINRNSSTAQVITLIPGNYFAGGGI